MRLLIEERRGMVTTTGSRATWKLLGACVFLCLGAGAWCQPAYAAFDDGVQVSRVTQQDLDGDGTPDLTLIDCSFATPTDRVLIYDRGADMQPGNDWQKVTDFANDTWLFDARADGSAQLIIAFEHREDSITASLYTDQDNDGAVAYEFRAFGQLFIREPPLRPPLIITAKGDWLRADGTLNWNLLFQSDGRAAPLIFLPDVLPISTDGRPDMDLEFKDADDDGIPEYGLTRLLAPSPLEWSTPRTRLVVNVGRHRPIPNEGNIFWPLLSTRFSGSNYFDGYPLIQMDWNTARIIDIGFPGYPIEQGYHVYTTQYFEKGRTNYADFENPMSYYDLANDKDGLPELHIRLVYAGDHDIHRTNNPLPYEEVRWSWNQTNVRELLWDYKLGLAGRYPITTTVQFPDFAYLSVPFEELPTWVISKPWDYATFVAREGSTERSSEGIYHWGAVEGLGVEGYQYLMGELEVEIKDTFKDLSKGWRGDLAPELNEQPAVYLSSVDKKLHLRKARQGIWNVIDGISTVHYANLDDDPYIDQWTYTTQVQGTRRTEPITITRQLDVNHSHLLYVDSTDTVIIRAAPSSPSVFETLPPTNNREWYAVKAAIDDHGRNFEPGDFRAMMGQFAGPETQILGAILRDYRPVGQDNFQFILELQPGFQLEGDDLLGVRWLSPGTYSVSYIGTFKVEPVTAPEIHIQTLPRGLLLEPAIDVQANLIRLRITNTGSENVKDLRVVSTATDKAGVEVLIGEQIWTVWGRDAILVDFPWRPLHAGDWTVRVKAFLPGKNSVEPDGQYEETIQVAQVTLPTFLQSVSAFGLVPAIAISSLFLAVLLIMILSIKQLFQNISRSRKPGIDT